MHQLLLTASKIALGITITGLGGINILQSPPVNAAERVSFSLPVLGEFYLSTESLEIFAKEKRITPEFAVYARYLDEESLDNLQQILQTNFVDDSPL